MKSDPRQVVADLVAAYNAKDLEAMRALYHPEVSYWSTLTGTNNGAEAVLVHVQELWRMLPDERMRPEAVVAGSEEVVVEFISTGTADGKPYEISFTEVIRLRDGRLYDIKVYLDPDAVAAVSHG